MAISKRMRDRIDTLLGVYVGHLSGKTDQAGFIGKSAWDNAVNCVGGGSSNDRSNAESIFQIRHIRDEHALYGLARMLLGRFDACRDCARHQLETGANGQRIYRVPDRCQSCNGRRYVFRDGKIKQISAVALHASREHRGLTYDQIAALVCMKSKQYENALLAGREELAQLLELRDAFKRAEREGALAGQ